MMPLEMDRLQEYSSPGFDWGKYLMEQNSDVAPVHLFPHAQMSSHWGEIDKGVKIEVLNMDCPVANKVYWIAQVVKVAGYKALLRYEGFGDDSQFDFWCHLCKHDIHAVGWCATIGRPLAPPKTIQFKQSNWKNFLVHQLTGSKTLPNDFHERVTQSMVSPFQIKMRLEVMDKTQISRKRVGVIEEIVGGRLRLQYEDSDEPNDDFWCHMGSPLIHHIGWSEKVGHRILVATKDYKTIPGFQNSKPELFASLRSTKTCGFKVGMKLEAIDPLNLSCICVATVRKVLKNGFLMIGIDGSEAAGGTDWFCYHCASPSIFPSGFCQANHINLTTPKGVKDQFSWKEYLLEESSEAASESLFSSEKIDHGFSAGMKLEAVDLMEPRLICVATIARVVGRLLRIHFDGWENEYDQWVDSQSCDIYPVGWCELVGYDLQPPVNMKGQPSIFGNSDKKKKNKTKNQGFGGKRKRKRVQGKKLDAAEDSTGAVEPGVKQRNVDSPDIEMQMESVDDAPASSPEDLETPASTNEHNKQLNTTATNNDVTINSEPTSSSNPQLVTS